MIPHICELEMDAHARIDTYIDGAGSVINVVDGLAFGSAIAAEKYARLRPAHFEARRAAERAAWIDAAWAEYGRPSPRSSLHRRPLAR